LLKGISDEKTQELLAIIANGAYGKNVVRGGKMTG
jgi:hypothetical protein